MAISARASKLCVSVLMTDRQAGRQDGLAGRERERAMREIETKCAQHTTHTHICGLVFG